MTKSLSRGLRGLAERAGSGEAGLARLARIGLREVSLVIILCLAAGGLWLFFSIAGGVPQGELGAFDTTILLSLRSAGDPPDTIGPDRMGTWGGDGTALGGTRNCISRWEEQRA